MRMTNDAVVVGCHFLYEHRVLLRLPPVFPFCLPPLSVPMLHNSQGNGARPKVAINISLFLYLPPSDFNRQGRLFSFAISVSLFFVQSLPAPFLSAGGGGKGPRGGEGGKGGFQNLRNIHRIEQRGNASKPSTERCVLSL